VWLDVSSPTWHKNKEYRLKPEEENLNERRRHE